MVLADRWKFHATLVPPSSPFPPTQRRYVGRLDILGVLEHPYDPVGSKHEVRAKPRGGMSTAGRTPVHPSYPPLTAVLNTFFAAYGTLLGPRQLSSASG